MIVKAFKSVDLEIDVSINIEHITSALVEALEECSQEVDQQHLANGYVNRIHQCLSGMPDALIAAHRRFLEQVAGSKT